MEGSDDDQLATVTPTEALAAAVERVGTMGDSSMMFMNAAIARQLGPMWTSVPAEFAEWTSGTGGFDRNGCGVTGDDYLITPNLTGHLHWPADHHDPVPEWTCDWRRWIPAAVRLAEIDTMVVSWGPTSMWGFEIDGAVTYVGDPTTSLGYDELRRRYLEARQALLDADVDEIVWIAYPKVFLSRLPDDQPWNWDHSVDAYRDLLASFGDEVVDLRDMGDPANFIDGVHFNDAAATRAAERIARVLQRRADVDAGLAQ